MAEKINSGRVEKDEVPKQKVDPAANHEAPVDQPQTKEKEQREKDLENLEEVADRRAESITNALIKREGAHFYPSEKAALQVKVADKLKEVFKSAYESGSAANVAKEMDAFVENAVEERQRDAEKRQLVKEAHANQIKLKEIDEEIKGLEATAEEGNLSAEAQDRLSELKNERDARASKIKEAQEYSEERWNNLSEEDKQAVIKDTKKSVNEIFNDKDLTPEQRKAKYAELNVALMEEWGPGIAAELRGHAEESSRASNMPATEKLEAAKRGEEDNPVRANAANAFSIE